MKIKDTIRERMPLAYIAPKPKFWKKTTILSVIAIMLLATIGVYSYGGFYDTIDTTMYVVDCGECTVLVEGNKILEFENICLDDNVWTKNKIKNTCSESTSIQFQRNVIEGNPLDINTAYYIIPGDYSLRLENKYTDTWEVIDNDVTYADITFNPCCPTFTGSVTVQGLTGYNNYTLIYYEDQNSERFGNPGEILEIVSFDGDGTHTFNEEINDCLPYNSDWNLHANPDYTNNGYDNYDHGKGAKLWIVPTEDIDGDELTWAHMNNYLYETDLIAYFDCDNPPCPDVANSYFSYEEPFTENCYTLGPLEEICFFIKHTFNDIGTFHVETAVEYCPN